MSRPSYWVGCGVLGGGLLGWGVKLAVADAVADAFFLVGFFAVVFVLVVALVLPVVGAVVVCSFLQEATNAKTISALMKAKRVVFIGLVRLNESENANPLVG